MAGYEVYLDSVALHDFMMITGIERGVLPPRTNYGQEIPSMYGQHYMGFNYDVREVKIIGYVEADTQETRNEGLYILADLLNVSEPIKMVTGDDPDRYFFAVPDSITQNRIIHNEEVVITFKCYDVYKYALEDDFFQPNENNIVTVVNGGSVETYPVTTISFSKQAYFVQCSNAYGETVLIGSRPSVDKTDSTGDQIVVSDTCESLANWTTSGNVVEAGYSVMGSAQVNAGGYGIICGDYGTSETGWHGVAMRRNLGKNVENFKATFTLRHNSKGDVKGIGAGTTPAVTSGQYTITADPSLRIRKDRSTTSTKLGSIPKGKVVTISNISKNWGKVTYSGVTGYVSMDYVKKYTAPTTTTYNIKALENVNIRSGAGTNYSILTTAKKGTTTTTKSTDEKNGWYKVTVSGKTGYTCAKYWEKTSTSKASVLSDTASAESKMGRLEVYGFGQNQERLFRLVLRDSEKYFEYTQPEGYIGSTKVLEDGKSCPSPKTTTTTESDGTKTVTKIDSGRFGDWNEFYGRFIVSRETNSKGQQAWVLKVEKVVDGKVTKTLSTNKLINTKYPNVPLNNIVVWYGKYKDEEVVDAMELTHVKVEDLAPVKAEENRPIFRAGDELVINHVENMCYLNGRPYMEDLDIGSQFFSVPTGESVFLVSSDDTSLDLEVGITKRYL